MNFEYLSKIRNQLSSHASIIYSILSGLTTGEGSPTLLKIKGYITCTGFACSISGRSSSMSLQNVLFIVLQFGRGVTKESVKANSSLSYSKLEFSSSSLATLYFLFSEYIFFFSFWGAQQIFLLIFSYCLLLQICGFLCLFGIH